MKYNEKTLKIDVQLGNLKGKASRLWWIGATYDKLNKPAKAIDNMEQALAIYKKLNLTNEVKTLQESLNRLKIEKL